VTVVTTQTDEQRAISIVIAHKLASLNLNATFVEPVSVGPIVSVYRFLPHSTTKVSHIESLSQDFALALGVEDVLVKRMPGEVAVGIFVPNRERKYVQWRDVCHIPTIDSLLGGKRLWQVPLILGVDHLGKIVAEDLTLFPHLLIAGSTGGGKSTLLNSLIATLIYNLPPDEVQFVLVDLKQVEFNHFVGAKHLLFEPAHNVYQALERMQWCIEEMEGRLKKFAKIGARNILEFNGTHQDGRLAYIVIVFDELASLLLDSRKEDEEEKRGPSLGRIAQAKLSQLAEKARATGIHIIAATQRSSVKVVEGNIKANFPARLTFRLPSQADSMTILGTSGAEHLLSRGDMLFVNPNRAGIQRIHAPLASIEDIRAAVEYSTRRQGWLREKNY